MNVYSRVLALAAISAGALLPAQGYVASPRGHLSTEGAGISAVFGTWSDARFMFFDGELRGIPGVLRGIALRVDSGTHTIAEVGRHWAGVTLDMSTCELTRLTATFSQNPTTTPARVFSSAVAWPTLNGNPPTNPAPWGGINGGLQFPFQAPWLHGGTGDLCLDFDFQRGTLADQRLWYPSRSEPYVLDGFTAPSPVAVGTPTEFGLSKNAGGCLDSNAPRGWGGSAFLGTQTDAISSTVRLGLVTQSTAAGRPVLQVLGLGGIPSGTAFPGITCQPLFVDLNQPTALLPGIATPSLGDLSIEIGPIPYRTSYVGVPLWLQAIWDDSTTTRPRLTSASRSAVPLEPAAFRRAMLFQNDPTAKNGTGYGPLTTPSYQPVFRFTM